MSLHINKFIDQVMSHEARGRQEFVMSMKDARNLAWDITKLLSRIEELPNNKNDTEIIDVNITGGNFR